jgi:hypothetical protein
VYKNEGTPVLVLQGEETAVFDGDRICRLEDRISEDEAAKVRDWMARHGDKLKTTS